MLSCPPAHDFSPSLQSVFLCKQKSGLHSSHFLNLSFPGDILGSAMQNLQNLIQMPYGCGEQNMVLFVPNIYVLNYLNETRQLTDKIKSKTISYLISGERLPQKKKP